MHRQGPDISQIGSTWLGSFIGLTALRMFRENEVKLFAGREAFIPSAWKGSQLQDVEEVFAIPWLSEVRVLAYRRDILEKARINETKAFINAEAFEDTLGRLQSAGVENIFALSTVNSLIYHIASWILGAGGDFRTPDLRYLTLTEPKTLSGIQQFCQLNRNIVPASRHLNMSQCAELFCQRGAAIVLTGYNAFRGNTKKTTSRHRS